MRELHPDARWGLSEQLLALVADLLAVSNWQRAGDKRAKKPEPIPRPGVGVRKQQIKARASSVASMRKWLDTRRG